MTVGGLGCRLVLVRPELDLLLDRGGGGGVSAEASFLRGVVVVVDWSGEWKSVSPLLPLLHTVVRSPASTNENDDGDGDDGDAIDLTRLSPPPPLANENGDGDGVVGVERDENGIVVRVVLVLGVVVVMVVVDGWCSIGVGVFGDGEEGGSDDDGDGDGNGDGMVVSWDASWDPNNLCESWIGRMLASLSFIFLVFLVWLPPVLLLLLLAFFFDPGVVE